ncbi:MAG: cupin domain-containing protein [Parvularculaceae bacterium]
MKKINIPNAFAQLDGPYQPKIAGDIDDFQVKIALIDGPFDWHKHVAEDEAFFVVEGEMVMEFRDHQIALSQGDFLVVPKNTEHRPNAASPCKVMVLEKSTVLNTGDVTTDKTIEDVPYVA